MFRIQFVELNTLLEEIEELFKNENYIQAQEKLNYILNNYHPAAFDCGLAAVAGPCNQQSSHTGFGRPGVF